MVVVEALTVIVVVVVVVAAAAALEVTGLKGLLSLGCCSSTVVQPTPPRTANGSREIFPSILSLLFCLWV